jgi:arylsulfatase A-like enzyme
VDEPAQPPSARRVCAPGLLLDHARRLAGVLGLAAAACSPGAGPPSIILVSIDTLRADHLGAYGSAAGLTPNLDRFAKSAVVFESAWTQANQTNLSHASLFTSRYPSELGAVSDAFAPAREIPTLASVLGVYGYDSAGFTGGGHLTQGFGLERGFARWDTPQELGSLFHTAPYAKAWLGSRESEAPFLLFLHSYDTHQRYLKPGPVGLSAADPAYRGQAVAIAAQPGAVAACVDGYTWPPAGEAPPIDIDRLRVHDAPSRAADAARAERFNSPAHPLGETDIAYLRATYAGAVAYADGWFGAFLDDLDTRGLLEESVVFVVSDHGESLGEDGIWGHSYSLTDADVHVPLLVRLPGGEHGGRRVADPVALLDVLPTVLELAGATAPAGIHGRSLVPALRGEPWKGRDVVFTEGRRRVVSARTATDRLTFAGVDPNSPFLSDLLAHADLAGPAFTASSTAEPATRAALRDAMLGWRDTLAPAERFERADAGLVESLKAHGYWDAR